ncbi:MAG: sugar transferase [Lachnospiraceae bacterium]|jgi:exopolysaccharide biosynthesis polyprenyl glycosylphosphotransferase|nr:sugar transferase [Lachnospiraceae bacterium]
MIHRGKIIEVYGLWLLDLACIWGAFLLATYIRHPNFVDMQDREIHFQVGVLFLLFCTAYSFILDWNHDFMRRGLKKEALAVFQYMMLMVLIIVSLLVFLKWADVFSRLILIYFSIINLVFTLLAHTAIKKLLHVYYSSDKAMTKVMVIADDENLDSTLTRLQNELESSYQIIAASCLGSDRVGQTLLGIPIIANESNIHEMSKQMIFDEVLINAPTIPIMTINELVRGFDEMGIGSHVRLSFDEEGSHYQINQYGGTRGYTVVSYIPVLRSHKRLLLKRVIDIVGGLAGTLFTLLLFPFVAMSIKLESRGPVFFSQIRIGRNGRRFRILKFRSMYQDAEEKKKELEAQNEMKGPIFKIKDDPRITKVGRFLRRFSIDELPQFLNVLRGDMSLVGTRPPTENEFEQYSGYYRRRLSMTPGLTGIWQISGRSNIEDFDEIVKFDLQYIDNWSLMLDMKILLKTVVVVFSAKGSK